MSMDRSEGWEQVAGQLMAARSDVGSNLVCAWACDTLPRGSAIIEVGCGSGAPIARALREAGFTICGIDASPTLIAAFRHQFPDAQAACEAAQDSRFFDRRFAAAIAIGLLFLLTEEDQVRVIQNVARAPEPGGYFLFTAPRQVCDWPDMLTGRPSRSLGEQAYQRHLADAGLRLLRLHTDEGGNVYFEADKPAADRL
jgi:SAM-dependent methyltransferase